MNDIRQCGIRQGASGRAMLSITTDSTLSNYQLRDACEEDLDFLYRLHVLAMKEYIDAAWGWDEAWQSRYFRRNYDPSRRKVVQVDGRDAGVLIVERRGEELYLADIALLPEYQRLGVGTALIREVIENAHSQRLPATLHVLKSNPAARRLYERLGFRVIVEERIRYKMANVPEPELQV